MGKYFKMPAYIWTPVLFSTVGLVVFQIPVIGVLFFLPLIPLAELYDSVIPGEFGKTGEHVEIGFAWITFYTWQAWLFYASFFFLVGLILGLGIHYFRKRSRRLQG